MATTIKAAKATWTVINLAPIAAAKTAGAATGSRRVATAVKLICLVDFATPGPIVSLTIIVVFGSVAAAKKLSKRIAKAA